MNTPNKEQFYQNLNAATYCGWDWCRKLYGYQYTDVGFLERVYARLEELDPKKQMVILKIKRKQKKQMVFLLFKKTLIMIMIIKKHCAKLMLMHCLRDYGIYIR